MKNTLYILLITLATSIQVFGQETILSPLNNPANKNLIKSETSEMNWFMLQDTLKVQIGKVKTEIQKKKENIFIITTFDIAQSPTKWIDSTVVGTKNFEPKYHSSYNQQRDMVLNFKEKITGYYLDKKKETKTEISEETETSFFDSNFYPQLIRFLPLKEGYSNTISIFDYNPTSKICVIAATIKSTEEIMFRFNGKERLVWKIETTDDISNNSAVSTYYINKTTRKILKQEIDFGSRKMVMELVEYEDFNQTIEKITADDILDDINNKGYATLYINFRPDKSILNGDSFYAVIEIAKMMKANPELNISIEGHTDNTGNATSNIKLSKKRAHAIFITLIMENIDNSRLKNKGFGQAKPIEDNSTEEGRAKNTRIVIRKT